MLAILGGGKLSSYLNSFAKECSIPITNFSRRKRIYGNSLKYKNIKQIKNLKLGSEISNCIINWSFTNPKSVKDIRKSVIGFKSISEFIKTNQDVSFLFISSTSASSGLLGNSNYGVRKRLGEEILLEINNTRKNKTRILRPGLIYGLDHCPIKSIVNLYKLGIKLKIGNSSSKFAVTSKNDLAKLLIDFSSQVWNSDLILNGLYEKNPADMEFIHSTCEKLISNKTINFSITKNSKRYKLFKLIGIDIDLSLASLDRYPSLKSIEYYSDNKFNEYIQSLCFSK